MFELMNRNQVLQESIVRLQTATNSLSWFGPGSVGYGIASSTVGAASVLEAHAEEIYRDAFVRSGSGTSLQAAVEELGVVVPTTSRAYCYLVVVPEVSTVTAISGSGPYTLTVSTNFGWQVGDTVRVKGATANQTSTLTAASSGSVTLALSGATATAITTDLAANNTVRLLFRATVAADSSVSMQGGVTFGTLASVTTGDANPLFAGEGTSLALVDKVLCECTTPGASGNVDRMSATGLVVAVRGVKRVFNPLPATGGTDAPDDWTLKYLAAMSAQSTAQSPIRSIEGLTQRGVSLGLSDTAGSVLRAFSKPTDELNTVEVFAITRGLGTLSTTEKSDLATYLAEYTNPGLTYTVSDITLTSVEVSAEVTLSTGPAGESAEARRQRLRDAWARVASAVSDYINVARWNVGTDVSQSRVLEIVLADSDIAAVDVPTFLPADDVTVGSESLPTLTSLVLTDASTGYEWGGEIGQVY